MNLTLKVEKQFAEKAKQVLGSSYDHSRAVEHDSQFVYFPVAKKDESVLKKIKGAFVEKSLKKIEERKSFEETLESKLSAEELEELKKSYDLIGSIAILEIPDELKKKEKIIAEALLKLNPKIMTVVKKGQEHSGVFRTRTTVFIAGKNTKETIHRENGVALKLNIDKVYFSPRLATERKRVANLIKKGEDVLVMFSGCAPYPLVIAKNSEANKVVGVEINPEGHKYALENAKLNKAGNVEFRQGDVRKVVPELKMKFDRIFMPLPKTADEFLDVAFSAAKKNAVVHFYDFLEDKDIPKLSVGKIKLACKKFKKSCKILKWVKCGQHSPRVFRVCIDFKVS